MNKELFFSVILDDERQINDYQILLEQNIIRNSITELQNPVRIKDDCFIKESVLDNLFLKTLLRLDPMEVAEFLNFHRNEYEGEIEKFIKKIKFLYSNFNKLSDRFKYEQFALASNPTYKSIDNHLQELWGWITDQTSAKAEKLQWLGTPAQFGYVLLELAKKGYIKIPQTGGQDSFRKFAAYCNQLFDIDTTIANLEKELNPKSNSLTYANREGFKILERDKLSKS